MICIIKHRQGSDTKAVMANLSTINDRIKDFEYLDFFGFIKNDRISIRVLRQALFDAKFNVYEFFDPFDFSPRGIIVTISSDASKMTSTLLAFMIKERDGGDLSLLTIDTEQMIDIMMICKKSVSNDYHVFGFFEALAVDTPSGDSISYQRLISIPFSTKVLDSITPRLRTAVRIRNVDGVNSLVAGDLYVTLNEDSQLILELADGSKSISDIASEIIRLKEIDQKRLISVKLKVFHVIQCLWSYATFIDSSIDQIMAQILFVHGSVAYEPPFIQHIQLDPIYLSPTISSEGIFSSNDLITILGTQSICLSIFGEDDDLVSQVILLRSPETQTFFVFGCFGRALSTVDWIHVYDYLETHEITLTSVFVKLCDRRRINLLVYGETSFLPSDFSKVFHIQRVGILTKGIAAEDLSIKCINL